MCKAAATSDKIWLLFPDSAYRVTQKNGHHQKSNNFQNFI